MKYGMIIILLAHVYTVLPAGHPPVDYGQQMFIMAALHNQIRFEVPEVHEPRRVRRGNAPRDAYDQQDRQLLAQQQKTNHKNRGNNNTQGCDRRQMPRKFNHQTNSSKYIAKNRKY